MKIMASSLPAAFQFLVADPQRQIWEQIAEKLSLPVSDSTHEYLLSLAFIQSKRIFPSIVGFLVGLSIVLVAWIWKRVQLRMNPKSSLAMPNILLVVLLIVGIFLTPTFILGGGKNVHDCGWDVITSYETVGEELGELIPGGSRVYWQGDHSPIPLLYITGIEIFPAQLNGKYSLRLGGDTDELLRYGYWNSILEKQWLEEADYILIEAGGPEDFAYNAVQNEPFELVGETSPALPCRADSSFQLYKRKG
jgi:hypothetical protein